MEIESPMKEAEKQLLDAGADDPLGEANQEPIAYLVPEAEHEPEEPTPEPEDRLFDCLSTSEGKASLEYRTDLTVLLGVDPQKQIDESEFKVEYKDRVLAENGELAYPAVSPPDPSNVFEYEKLQPPKVVQWVKAMPNIANLEVSFANVSFTNIHHLIYMVKNFGPNLDSLKIYISLIGDKRKIEIRLVELNNAINTKCTKLKHLTLHARNQFRKFDVDLPVLSHLEEFYFYTKGDPITLLKTLQLHATGNEQLRTICIANEFGVFDSLNDYATKLDDCVRSCFVDLRFSEDIVNYDMSENVMNLLDRFPKLVHFRRPKDNTLKYNTLTLLDITVSLQNLTELTFLGLHMKGAYNVLCKRATVVPLRSVKVIQLEFDPYYHDVLTNARFAQAFPNVQYINIIMGLKCYEWRRHRYHCTKCGYEADFHRQNQLAHKTERGFLECAKCILKPLTECAQLREIALSAKHPQHAQNRFFAESLYTNRERQLPRELKHPLGPKQIFTRQQFEQWEIKPIFDHYEPWMYVVQHEVEDYLSDEFSSASSESDQSYSEESSA